MKNFEAEIAYAHERLDRVNAEIAEAREFIATKEELRLQILGLIDRLRCEQETELQKIGDKK